MKPKMPKNKLNITAPRYKDNIFLSIRRLSPNLNPALRRVAEFILENPETIKLQKISELAKECKVSESTITRFVREIKLKNFQELKIAFAEMSSSDLKDSTYNENYIYGDVTRNNSIESIFEKIAYRNIEALNDTIRILSATAIKKAVSAIENCNVLSFYCIGASTIAAEHAKLRFYRIGKKSIVYSDPAQQGMSSSLIGKHDVAIGISNSGRSAPTVNSLKRAKKNGATTICITNIDNSPILDYSEIKLFTPSIDSPFFHESMVSGICQILIVDILYSGYAVKHFDRTIELIEKTENHDIYEKL